MGIAGVLQLKHWFLQTAEKRLHALGEEEHTSVCAVLAFKGKCAVEKEGMIEEIKLKCRKKNISNRRELLPVVLAKMLSRCSVRMHGWTGRPADYLNTMLSWKVLGKLSYFYSLRELSTSVQLWPWGGSLVPCLGCQELSPEPGRTAHEAFSQYLSALLPNGLGHVQKHRKWRALWTMWHECVLVRFS